MAGYITPLMSFSERLIIIMKKNIYFFKKIWNICSISLFVYVSINLILHLSSPIVLYYYKRAIYNIEKNNLFFSILYIIIIIFFNIFNPFLSWLLQINREKLQYIISKTEYSILFNFLSNIDITYFDKKELYIKIERAKNAIVDSMLSLFTSSIDFLGHLISITLIAYMLIKENPLVFILLIIMGILQNIFLHKSINDSIALIKTNETDIRKENYFGNLFTKREFIKELHLFSMGIAIEKKREKYFNKIRDKNKKYNIKWTKINLFWASIMYIFEGILTFFVIFLLWSKKIEINDMIFIFQSQDIFIQTFSNLIQLLPQIAKNHFYLESLYEIENYVFEKKENKIVEICEKEEVIISNVFFNYNTKNVLKNINLEISKGEKIVIVGENGCGKSTLIKLICGLLYPNSGTILNNACKIAVIFQDYAKFYTTLRENIAFGSLEKLNDDLKLKEILKVSFGDRHINKFNNLDVGLSSEFFDSSLELSGGEWQRLALARCIAADADLIILDESTSALDPFGEKDHYNLFDTLFNKKTIITVTHRLNKLLDSDKIVFMKNGEINEYGSHLDLIAKRGNYFTFFNSTIKDKEDSI